MALPTVLTGRSANAFLALAFFASCLLLFYGLPVSLVLCNVGAARRGGRRVVRCVAISAVLVCGLALSWWLLKADVRPRLALHSDGPPTLDYSRVRLRGLLACGVATAIPVACFFLLRPRAREAPPDSESSR